MMQYFCCCNCNSPMNGSIAWFEGTLLFAKWECPECEQSVSESICYIDNSKERIVFHNEELGHPLHYPQFCGQMEPRGVHSRSDGGRISWMCLGCGAEFSEMFPKDKFKVSARKFCEILGDTEQEEEGLELPS